MKDLLKNKEKLLVQSHYPLEFKRMVCELFLKGDKNKEEATIAKRKSQFVQ